MGGWLRLASWHLHGISARDVPGVTDVLQLAGWQQLTEVRLFCSRFRMRFFDSKDGIGDSRNRDEPENIRDSSFPGEIHHRDTESTKFSLGLPEDTLSGGSCVARLFALQYIHSQAISKREKTRTTAPANLLLPCRSWCSLCLRGEIFFLREPRRTLFDGRAVCSMRSLRVIPLHCA